MNIRKASLAGGFIVFPAALLMIYWGKMYVYGNEIDLIIPGAVTFATLGTMILLEQVFRYKKAVSQKPIVSRDILSTMMNVFVTGTVMRMIFVPLVLFFPEIFFGRTLFFGSPDQLGPLWLQLILVIFLYSFLRYGVHRTQHKVPFLWELHSYHHSVTDLKASNTFVSHPIDFSLRNVLPPVILAAVGFNPIAILFGVGILNTASTFSHCGAGLHAGWLNYVFVTPEIHRWHHSARVPKGHKFSVNYGVGFCLWDRIFGTFYLPTENGIPLQPDKIGHPGGYKDEGNYLKLFFLARYLPKFMQSAPK